MLKSYRIHSLAVAKSNQRDNVLAIANLKQLENTPTPYNTSEIPKSSHLFWHNFCYVRARGVLTESVRVALFRPATDICTTSLGPLCYMLLLYRLRTFDLLVGRERVGTKRS